jgi:hypothetical protein
MAENRVNKKLDQVNGNEFPDNKGFENEVESVETIKQISSLQSFGTKRMFNEISELITKNKFTSKQTMIETSLSSNKPIFIDLTALNQDDKISSNVNIDSLLKESNQTRQKQQNISSTYSSNNKLDNNKTLKSSLFSNYNKNLNSRKKNEKSSDSLNLSNGERLYRRSMISVEKTKKSISALKNRLDEVEKINCTFQPQIDENSKALFMKSNLKSNKQLPTSSFKSASQLPSNSLSPFKKNKTTLNSEEKSDEKSAKKNKKLSEEEMNKLFEKLYKEKEYFALNKEKLKEEFYSQFRFSPELVGNSEPQIKNFYARLQAWLDSKKEKCKEIQEKINKFDENGVPLFKPKLVEKKDVVENRSNVYDGLYNIRNKKIEFSNVEKKKHQRVLSQLSNKKHITAYSEEIVNNQLNNKIYKEIFCLIGNQKEEIDFAKFDIRNIPQKIQSLLEELIIELINKKQRKNTEEFVAYCSSFFGNKREIQKTLFDWYFIQISEKKKFNNKV